MRKVKIAEVAARAGVSRATVDRVLNRRGGVSTGKERAVFLSARALGIDRNLEAMPVKQLRVCVLMTSPENPFYARLARGFREASLLFAEQAITAYISYINVLSPASINRKLRQTASNYDALVIVAPANGQILDTLTAIAQRIPVVTLATDLPLNAPHHYVGPSNYQAGRLAGEIMGRLLGRGGHVLLVAGLNDFSGHQERRSGFYAALREDYPACAVAAEIDSFDRGASVATAVTAALKGGKIRGIYNISQGNDEITRRIQESGIAKNFVFICHDLTPTTRELLLARHVDVVIDQDPLLEARRAMELVLSHYGRLDAGVTDGRTPVRVVFRENATVAS